MFRSDRSMLDPRPTISNSSLTIFPDHWPGNSIVPFKWFDYPWGICLPMVGFTPAKRIPIERHDYVNTSNNVGTIVQNCSSSVSIPIPFVIIGGACVSMGHDTRPFLEGRLSATLKVLKPLTITESAILLFPMLMWKVLPFKLSFLKQFEFQS